MQLHFSTIILHFALCIQHLIGICELYNQLHIVVVGALIAHYLSAFVAFKNDDKALFGVGERLNGTEHASAGVISVPRHNVYVQGREALRTMIA